MPVKSSEKKTVKRVVPKKSVTKKKNKTSSKRKSITDDLQKMLAKPFHSLAKVNKEVNDSMMSRNLFVKILTMLFVLAAVVLIAILIGLLIPKVRKRFLGGDSS
jgi:subtilase family serine protease